MFVRTASLSTLNLCFEQKYEKYQSFLSENFKVLEVKFSIYLNRHVFVMKGLTHLGCLFSERCVLVGVLL